MAKIDEQRIAAPAAHQCFDAGEPKPVRMVKLTYAYDDGGRFDAGFRGSSVGDCVARSIAIVTARPYKEIYDRLAAGNRDQRASAKERGSVNRTGRRTAQHGIFTKRAWFKRYMAELGFVWHATMQIGSGCTVHLHDDELPAGRLVVKVSKHLTAVIDGEIRDTYDPRQEVYVIDPYHGGPLKPGQWRNPNGICSVQRRCVYGYWRLVEPSGSKGL